MLELYTKLQTRLAQVVRRQEGQTMAEYAIVLGVISVGIIAALVALSGGISGALSKITADI
jgi:Flp pilus assembly pilin Flp